MSKRQEKLNKIELKIRKPHPKNAFRLGRFVITNEMKSFELNESEMKELKSKGCQFWLISKEDFEAEKEAKAKAAKAKK